MDTRLILAFAAGFLAVLVFHQGVWAVFSALGKTPAPAWSMQPTGPLHVPQVLSSAFWGGVWGVVLALLAPSFVPGLGYWTGYTVVGALLTTLVALFVVFPLKGRPFAAGWSLPIWAFALLVNAAWALGTAILLRLLGAWR